MGEGTAVPAPTLINVIAPLTPTAIKLRKTDIRLLFCLQVQKQF